MSSVCLILSQVQIIFQCMNLLFCYLSYLISPVKLDHKSWSWTTKKYWKHINISPQIDSCFLDFWADEDEQVRHQLSGFQLLQKLSCRCKNVQCSFLYLTQHSMVGTGFNCLVTAKVLLTVESIHPSTSQLLITGCLCLMPEEQLLDHVAKW